MTKPKAENPSTQIPEKSPTENSIPPTISEEEPPKNEEVIQRTLSEFSSENLAAVDKQAIENNIKKYEQIIPNSDIKTQEIKKETKPNPEPPKPSINILSSTSLTRPTQIKPDSGRPIKIIYENSFLSKSLDSVPKTYTDKQKEKMLSQVNELISKSDAYLRHFVSTKGRLNVYDVPENLDTCNDDSDDAAFRFEPEFFTSEISYRADLIIFTAFYYDKIGDMIAFAFPCDQYSDLSFRVATIQLNIYKIFEEFHMESDLHFSITMNTIVHEIFHLLAFNEAIMPDFLTEVTDKFPHLNLFKENEIDSAVVEDHFNPMFIHNDLMAPFKKPDALLTIFSLEYIELGSRSRYLTNRQNLPNNKLIDEVKDWKHFLNYKCEDNKYSEYQNFCSRKQANEKRYGCDPHRFMATKCASFSDRENILPNGCTQNLLDFRELCIDESNQKNNLISIFGKDSRCFEGRSRAYCFGQKIVNNQLFIVGKLGQYKCEKKDDIVQFEYKFKEDVKTLEIFCPDPAEFISIVRKTNCPKYCHNNGLCHDGQCVCFEGFSSADDCFSSVGTKTEAVFTALY